MVGKEHVTMIPSAPKTIWSATVNGQDVQAIAPSNAILLDVLRDEVGMLGVKRGAIWVRAVVALSLSTVNLVFRVFVLQVKLKDRRLRRSKDSLKALILPQFKPASLHMAVLNVVFVHLDS